VPHLAAPSLVFKTLYPSLIAALGEATVEDELLQQVNKIALPLTCLCPKKSGRAAEVLMIQTSGRAADVRSGLGLECFEQNKRPFKQHKRPCR
jgi:hypothetical protein